MALSDHARQQAEARDEKLREAGIRPAQRPPPPLPEIVKPVPLVRRYTRWIGRILPKGRADR